MRAFTLILCLALAGCGTLMPLSHESPTTMENWRQARLYQSQGRYELAKQHYALALSGARSTDSATLLQRELFAVDMQLRTMR